MPQTLVETSVIPRNNPSPGSRDYQLSLVIPALNEEDTIGQAIREAETALTSLTSQYEIIVVDDGSSDATAAIVELAGQRNPCVRLVCHESNAGYGAALRSGFQAATCDLVAFTDADCQFDLGELEYMLPLTEKYAITCGFRMDRQDPAKRRFFSWGYNTLTRMLLGNPVHDVDCALKIFHKDQLPAVLPECNNFFVNTEMLSRARQLGLSVVEVGVHHRPRAGGQSKVSLSDIPKTLSTLLPYWWSNQLFPARDAERKSLSLGTWLALLLLALLAGGLLFHNLSYPLLEPDEGRYAEISREMVVSGDWVVPTLHNQPYLDKPPLMYWLVGGALKLFGTQVWVARLIPALATFLTIFVTFAFGRRIIGTRAAFLGAFALALMGGVVFCGRALLLDSVLTLFVVLALFTGYEAGRGPRLSWNWWLASGFFCALGILVKGPIAFILVAPPVFACGCLDRRRARPGLRHWAAYLAILTAMVAPWFVAVLFRCPQFAYYFLVEHHLFRFFGSDFHSNPVWYYIPVLFFGCMPWSLLLVPMAGFLFERRAEARSLRTEGMGYLLLWALWCLFFFSLSRGKLPPYILPAIPALALLVGKILEIVLFKNDLAFLLSKARRKIPRQSALFLAIGWIVFLVWCWFRGEFDSARYLWGFVEVLLCLAALTAILCFRRNSRLLWVLTCILMAGFILEASNGFLPTWSAKRSPVARMHEVDMFLKDKNAGVVCLRQDWGSIPFYLDNRQDFFHAEKSSPPEVHAYLRRHGHNLLISDYQWDEQKVYPFIPPDLEIMKVFLSGKARFYVIGPNTRQVRCP